MYHIPSYLLFYITKKMKALNNLDFQSSDQDLKVIEAIRDESRFPFLIISLGGEELFTRSFVSHRYRCWGLET